MKVFYHDNRFLPPVNIFLCSAHNELKITTFYRQTEDVTTQTFFLELDMDNWNVGLFRDLKMHICWFVMCRLSRNVQKNPALSYMATEEPTDLCFRLYTLCTHLNGSNLWNLNVLLPLICFNSLDFQLVQCTKFHFAANAVHKILYIALPALYCRV